jgi:hypothetical protein
MAEQSKLLVVEAIVPPAAGHHLENSLTCTCWQSPMAAANRTEAEYRDLLARAGFNLMRVIPTAGLQSVLEAVPRLRDS